MTGNSLPYKAGVIISKTINNKVHYLLVKSFLDIWSFPKGHLLPDEDFSFGASRELFEETGIQIDPVILLNCKFKMLGLEKYFLLNLDCNKDVYIPDDLSNNKIQDNNEIKCIDWISLENINKINTNCSIRRYLNIYKEDSGRPSGGIRYLQGSDGSSAEYCYGSKEDPGSSKEVKPILMVNSDTEKI